MTKLSVIIPFYKDHAFVEQAVHSVLVQGIADCEIVLVNDNPGAESDHFLRALNFPESVRIITHQHNRGLSAARNTGVENARGEWIAYLDADDYYLPGALARQLRLAVKSGSDVTHATTMLRERTSNGMPVQAMVIRDLQFFRRDVEKTDVRETSELQFIVSSWKSIYRKDHLQRTGIKFDEAQRKFEDRLYVLDNVFSGASFALMSEPARVWRRRQGSITTSRKTDADLVMMANLVDKCTGLLEQRARDGGFDPVYLKREVFHSVSRLVWDTGLLDAAFEQSEIGNEIQQILVRAINRAELDPSIFTDPVLQVIDRTGLPNSRGVKVDPSQFVALHKAIAGADWKGSQRIWNAAGGNADRLTPGTLAHPAIRKLAPLPLQDVELTLHVGLHKTGTTHLQHRFRGSRADLARNGWFFPDTGFVDHADTASKVDATPGHQGLITAAVDVDMKVRRELVREIRESGCKKVLISCENMSLPHVTQDLRLERIAALKEFFGGFKQIRVVATLRRPDAYFEALYRERVSNAELRESRSALNFLEIQGHTILDFNNMLAPWKEVANGELLLLSYEQLAAEPDYFKAFARALGIEVPERKKSAGRTYASPKREVIEVMRLINALAPPTVRKVRTSRNFVLGAQKLQQRPDSSVLHIDARKQIVETVRANSEEFLRANGLEMQFDRMLDEIEAERESWTELDGINREMLHLLVHAAQLQDSQDRWANVLEDRSSILARTKDAVLRVLKSDRARTRLMSIYRAIPGPAKRLARAAYQRIAH